MSYGNLLDSIAFKEYYYAKVEVAMNNSPICHVISRVPSLQLRTRLYIRIFTF